MPTERSMAEQAAAELILGADIDDFDPAFAEAVADCVHTRHDAAEGPIHRHEFEDGSAIVTERLKDLEWDIGLSAAQCRDPEIIARVAVARFITGAPHPEQRPPEFVWAESVRPLLTGRNEITREMMK